MELENKKKVAVDDKGNVMAFKYQSASRELEVEDYPKEWADEEIFTEQQVNKFKVVDGVVVRRTDEEIKADPNYIIYQKEKRAEAYVNESDALFFKYQRGEIDKQAWLDKVAEIKARYPKE